VQLYIFYCVLFTFRLEPYFRRSG